MKIFKTCRTLNMFRFYEILNTKDYKYLIDDYENVKIDEDLKKELDKIWNELFREYITLKDDKQIKLSFKQLAYISKLETKLFICKELLKGLLVQSTKKGLRLYIKLLGEWGYKIYEKKNLQKEVDRIVSDLKTLTSSINIKKAEFEKTHKKELTEERINIDKIVANMEQILEKNEINQHTTMVSKWLEYVKIGEKISKQNEKIRAKHG